MVTTRKATGSPAPAPVVERVQLGVRLEKRLVKVLKGVAEYCDLSLADLLEGIALHALENKPPFSRATLARVQKLRDVYGLDLRANSSHRLRELPAGDQSGAGT